MNWDSLLTAGKECYNQQDWLRAEYFTRKAEALLINGMTECGVQEEVLLAWICANHNLAAIFEQQGDTGVALQYLLQAHQLVVSLCEEVSDADMVNLSLNALSITVNRLSVFREQHPVCKLCYTALADYERTQQRQQVVAALH